MDWSFIGEHLPLYAEAAQITLTISFFGVLFSLIVGLISAQISLSKIPILSQLNAVYVELSRGTPLLIQLFLIYFGLTKVGLKMNAEVAAVVGLTFLGGSYMAEVFRAGFESVAAIQFESAQVLGLSKIQTLQHVILPQALSVAVPGLVANVIFLIKESSVVSGIALADLMYVTKDIIGMQYDTTEALFMLVIAYVIILVPISLIGSWLERRLDYARR
ncbi:amino acid ABC transporter permease [Lancefieldella parvula]|uniref:amino acid ABC transporter permease n=1 Tax=Lancefieldella parvula TaxID=1382 RepID=UPI00288A71EF|nr:amino acid ABC transporter permease [Lancefieldella parvula]